MKILLDFQCENGHVTEKLISSTVHHIICDECGKEAHRLIATPRVKLEPFSGAFPGAYYAWNRKREEALKQERKRSYSDAASD